METILEGIGIGVSAGLITTLIVGMFGWMKHPAARRNQRKYIAKTISYYRSLIYQANDFEAEVGLVKEANVQKAFLDAFQREIESIVRGRASSLSYDEVHENRKVLFTDLFPQAILNEANYRDLFGNLANIKWLKLPHKVT